MDPAWDREDAILGVPEDRVIRSNFGRDDILDLTTPEHEYAAGMYPVSQVFEWDSWQDGFDDYWKGDQHAEKRRFFRSFKQAILENFKRYHVPVIALDRSTSKEAVCVVFEKVNTGGNPLLTISVTRVGRNRLIFTTPVGLLISRFFPLKKKLRLHLETTPAVSGATVPSRPPPRSS